MNHQTRCFVRDKGAARLVASCAIRAERSHARLVALARRDKGEICHQTRGLVRDKGAARLVAPCAIRAEPLARLVDSMRSESR